MKKAILILVIVFSAGSALAQQHNLIGERSIFSPFDTYEKKPSQDEVTNIITNKKEPESKPISAPQQDVPSASVTENSNMMGSRAYSSTKELFIENKDATDPAKDMTPTRHEMIGERSLSSVSAVYAQTNTQQPEQQVDTEADNTTTIDSVSAEDNATAIAPTADNVTIDNATADNTTVDNVTADNATSGKNWLNSLFDTEKSDQKIWAAVNYSWLSPQNSEASYLKAAFGLSAGYLFNKYFGAELGFRSMNGKKSSQSIDATTGAIASLDSKVDMFDISAMATARYSFKLWKGEVMPYIGAGVGYVSATKKDSNYVDGYPVETSRSANGFSITGRAGVRYGIGMFILGANVQYIYNRLSFEKEYDFSSISYGLEAGLRF